MSKYGDVTSAAVVGLLDHVTVLIGIAVKGKAVAGVIYQPYHNYQAGPTAVLGRIVWGIVGLGNYHIITSCILLWDLFEDSVVEVLFEMLQNDLVIVISYM